MSSTTCECPCECPLTQCQGDGNFQKLPICPEKSQNSIATNKGFNPLPKHLTLPPCFDTDCGRHGREDKCFGIIGCSWCKYHEDGQQLLDEAFCSNQAECFGGVRGSPTPYDQLDSSGFRSMEGHEDYFGDFRPTAPSVGPIAGSILAAVLFLGLSGYCIRNVNKCACIRDRNNARRLQRRSGSMIQVRHGHPFGPRQWYLIFFFHLLVFS